MSTALAERPQAAPTVTSEELELVKRTVAQGATAEELKLYLYDCARQGVHPLDRLVHFTKRGGKYTPITSIDFMRIRAAETGEYAGSDDAVFLKDSEHNQATVTVWRMVQGQRCPFTATARWDEYKPEANDFMWRKMPHTMLAKCAEALALRKGFPKQLAGLYAREEMDQAGVDKGEPQTGDASWKAAATDKKARPSVPDGVLFIDEIVPRSKGNREWAELTMSNGEMVVANAPQLISLAYSVAQDHAPVELKKHLNTKGNQQLDGLDRWSAPKPQAPVLELKAEDISF